MDKHGQETLDAIKRRRTTRKFKADAVGDDVLRELLEAAMCAPSAGDERPWNFIVCTERTLLDKLAETHPYALMLKQAPAAIVVLCDMTHEHLKNHAALGCAAATENILIAAEAKRLGAAWLGVFPEKDREEAFRKLFGLPAHITPFALVPVGHPAEEKLPKDRFDASCVRYNKW